MQEKIPEKTNKEKRSEPRRAKLRNHRIEIQLVGNPIYQFRVVDITSKGAGILIKDDSAFLHMIAKDLVVEAKFISPQGLNPFGIYSVKIQHITTPNKEEYKGHRLVGISLLRKLREL